MNYSDVIIIGSGLSALQLAAKLNDKVSITVLTKNKLKSNNSYLAQGGVASAFLDDDHPQLHTLDTLNAGRHFNQVNTVEEMTSLAPNIIHDLIQGGCEFDCDRYGNYALAQEGAHSKRRIFHAGGDQTGKYIVKSLLKQLKNKQINIIEHAFVYELLTDNNRCYGVKYKNFCEENHIVFGKHIVLATGGCGQLYSYTSNAEGITGDGLTLAFQAGAELSNLEFIQFHPTLLTINQTSVGLISEAVRGEGARLVIKSGQPIMNHHPMRDLAPRDCVAQTIYNYIKKEENIYLDVSMINNFNKRFPSITQLCERNGVDLTEGLIPVAPGAHFMMGGVTANLYGKTSVNGLYAIGEVANTGFHGANRLASNSLLEGLVMGKLLAKHINATNKELKPMNLVNTFNPKRSNMNLNLNLPPVNTLKHKMMEHVGIIRTSQKLNMFIHWLESYDAEKCLHYDFDQLASKEIEKIFSHNLALLISQSALDRTESRGAHKREDYPHEDNRWKSKHTTFERRVEREQVTT